MIKCESVLAAVQRDIASYLPPELRVVRNTSVTEGALKMPANQLYKYHNERCRWDDGTANAWPTFNFWFPRALSAPETSVCVDGFTVLRTHFSYEDYAMRIYVVSRIELSDYCAITAEETIAYMHSKGNTWTIYPFHIVWVEVPPESDKLQPITSETYRDQTQAGPRKGDGEKGEKGAKGDKGKSKGKGKRQRWQSRLGWQGQRHQGQGQGQGTMAARRAKVRPNTAQKYPRAWPSRTS